METPPEAARLSASWGELVEFLRTDCAIMKTWILDMQVALIPQNKAILQFAFQSLDAQCRGVCHPQQLSNTLSLYPSAVKVLSGTSVIKTLSQLRLEIPMFVDPMSGKVCDIAAIQNNQYKLQDMQRVVYEVPICWEELLALYVIDIPGNMIDLLRVQQLILLGMSEIFQKSLPEAEEHMIEALQLLEALGMETEPIAAELYNSIAQMMIMKHRDWHSQKNTRCKANAIKWVESEEGMRELMEEVDVVMRHYRQKHIAITRVEAEARSRSVLIKARSALLSEMEVDTTLQSVEAAFRYLVRGMEIMEKAHKTDIHPSVATSCLAVASVQNVCNNLQDAREWLMKCLRILEKLNPIPERAIAFVHVQLSNVLMKLEHEEEAMRILTEASNFYLNKSREGLVKHISRLSQTTEPGESFPLYEPVTKYGPSAGCYSDIMLTLEYTRKLLKLNAELTDSGKLMAIDKSIVIAEMLESAFGWDSKEAGKQRKEIGDLCMAVSDFGRAHEQYTRHLEACEMTYGDNDKRTTEALHRVQSSLKSKMRAMNIGAEREGPPGQPPGTGPQSYGRRGSDARSVGARSVTSQSSRNSARGTRKT